ncbi:hypothetical protein J1N35_044162 [Gossypium stocksii]|uniref:Uncharacterized protein n=1 Tax=Gossypium stocksii TaxID=47602 RepID=A0A9D3ZG35_9ROSI|nr:hypothetical protein J1N35_044162 [Gossypium stocksii]
MTGHRRVRPNGRFEAYTPLNATQTYILTQVKSLGILPKPPPMRNIWRRVNSKDWCVIHDDIGRKIEDCFMLKNATEKAIRNCNDLMVVLTIVAGFKVKRILVDNKSAVEVLSWDTYQKMGLDELAFSKASPLYGFTNHSVEVRGSITLLVTLGDDKHTTTEYVQFQMVDHPMVYNVIFGRPWKIWWS